MKFLDRIKRIDITKLHNNWFKWLEVLMSTIGIIVTLIGSIYAFKDYKEKFIKVTEIPVGIGPYQIESPEKLELQYIYILKEANDNLRKFKSHYRLFPKVINNDRYISLLYELQNDGEFIIAPIAPFTYLMWKNEKLNVKRCDDEKCDSLKILGYKSDSLRILGYKRIGYRTIYKSRMIWNGHCKKRNYTEILNYIKNYSDTIGIINKSKVILTKEELSTSCFVLPEIFLYEHGINMKKYSHLSLNRPEMINLIIKNKDSCLVGFINNDDFDQLSDENKENLNFYDLDIPIPYDVFLANKSKWDQLDKEEQCKIINSLQKSNYGIIPYNGRDNISYKYDLFQKYVGSGIVCIDSSSGKSVDTLIIKPNHLLQEWKVESRAKIYSFYEDKYSLQSTLDTICFGTIRIKKLKTDIYKFTDPTIISIIKSKKISLQGLHILPID